MPSLRSLRRLAWCLVLSLLVCFVNHAESRAQESPRPNIVIILVDDMGYSDIGCYGSEIETPHIDSLAAEGLRFTQFYNCGRCCPTRASLMTGLHPHQAGIGHMTEPPERPLGIDGPYQGFLNDRCSTLAQVLRTAGYRTVMTGKWHLGYHRQECWPLQRGFERYFGCISGGCNYFRPGGDRGITEGNEPFEVGDGFYTTDAFTDKAIEYLREVNAEGDDPFFLYLAYNAPHWPLNAKWEDYLKYKGRYTEGWESLMRTRFQRQQELGLFPASLEPAPHVGPAWDSLTDEQRTDLAAIMAAYAGCIDSIDQNVGKLLTYLDESGERDNTIIFFLSDNGACQEGGVLGQGNEEMIRNPPGGVGGVHLGLAWANACNTPLRLYKHFVHEGGAATPMIVNWPAGIAAEQRGSFVREYAYLPDFMPTVMALSGAEYPGDLPPLAGTSLLPLLAAEPSPIHTDPIYWEHEGNAAMRWGDWKLVRENQKPWELYRVNEDRAELHNLADQQPDQRREMVRLWKAWADAHEVMHPQPFNMYRYLQQQRERERDNNLDKE
ncbi:MAG: arylsulfatase [Planctomycetales bacterium]|nr:arylsulfatase [Planctomycetales bacterium]